MSVDPAPVAPARPRLLLVPPPAARRHERRADIQGLRAVAVLLVVLFHAGLGLHGGFTGVDVFFVISGYVIAGSLAGELETTGRLSFAAFYARRVKRLLPALAAMLVFVAVAGVLASPAATGGTGAITGAFAAVMSANVYLYSLLTGYFDTSTTLNPLLHTWTLAVEEQIYLVFPLLLLAGWRFRRGGRVTVAVLVAGLAAASFVYSRLLSSETIVVAVRAPERLAFYSSMSRAWEFGAGVVLVLATPLVRKLPPLGARLLGLVGLGLVAWAALLASPLSFPSSAAILPVLGTCAILASGAATSGGTARVLAARPLRWIGDRSYGWYLWHWPLIVFAVALWPNSRWAAPVAAAVALVPTALSYRRLENRIRRNPRVRVVRLALVCTLVPLAASLAAWGAAHAIAGSHAMQSWTASRALHADVVRGCDDDIPLSRRALPACTWEVAHPRGRIVLFGDSNAGHLTEPVVRAGNRAGFDVTVATLSSCPFVGVGTDRASCRRFAAGTMADLVRIRPSLVFVAARTDLYLDGRTTPGRWRRALTATLRRLNGAGIPVVLVHPVPRLPAAPDGCATLRVLLGTCGGSVSRADAEAELAPAKTVEAEAIAAAPRTWALDLDRDLCSASRCSPVRRGEFLYRDNEHLSIRGALGLTPRFAQAIAAHAR